jgi:hypothetical protein
MLRWVSLGAVVAVGALVAAVAWDWWRFPVVDPRLGYRPRFYQSEQWAACALRVRVLP